MSDFDHRFELLIGSTPFPWQRALYDRLRGGDVPHACEIPTGLGKTSVVAVWWLALNDGADVPRRLVYVVNRRTVVDQTTFEVERLRQNAHRAGIAQDLAVSTLRGQMADNRAWSEDPSRPAVISGTVDMIGSRLLFSGYRIGFRLRPLHAGFLGQDAWLVHDEAHLEPAFQRLVESIVAEQKRAGDRWPLRVTALTATRRTSETRDESVLRLSDADRAHPVVGQRVHAKKALSLHVETKLVDDVVARVLALRESGCAILVYLRAVDDVHRVEAALRKQKVPTQILTGTMRGYERDRLVEQDPIYARFLPGRDSVSAAAGTVVLLSTSAGEVGVNLSADHMVCDLSTFDAMTQRFGRVNRFGVRSDTEIHVVHPSPEDLVGKSKAAKAKDEDDRVSEDSLDLRRARTLELLRALEGDASSAAIDALDADARAAAFAPEPQTLPATEILFDAWAMTSIRGVLPGRPPVSPYLHGVAEWEPPTTSVAWREEVSRVAADDRRARDLIEDYPLKPHELLSDRTDRVVATLLDCAQLLGAAATAVPVWVLADDGGVSVETLGALTTLDKRRLSDALAGKTLLLPALGCRPVNGLFSADGFRAPASSDPESPARPSADVADEWYERDGEHLVRRRARVLDATGAPDGMRLIRTLPLGDPDADEADDQAEANGAPRSWSWFERPRGADDEGSRSSPAPVLLAVHSSDVEERARSIVAGLSLSPGLARAVVLAAKHHDDGKARAVWQRSIGNADQQRVLAKGGGAMRPRDITNYRHELGSVLEAEATLAELEPEERELALHLIAAHHGRARPHFPQDELFDPEARHLDMDEVGARIMDRFSRLQRRYGRWGLAYLESLVRAADYAASAAPSRTEEVTR